MDSHARQNRHFLELAMTDTPDLNLVSLTADITSAYVSNNKVASSDVARLIESIHNALDTASAPVAPEPAKPEPVVSIRASVKPDSITCLECGQKSKMLKRHLQTAHGLTPADYREKWGLPRDYPMVAPAYAAERATLAKSIGLGRKKAEDVVEAIARPVKTVRRKLGIAAAKAAAIAHLGGEHPAPSEPEGPVSDLGSAAPQSDLVELSENQE
jgi:predicted transcriptional regulator